MFKFNQAYKWVPSVYMMEGIPFALINFTAPVFYKNFAYSNTKIAFFTSLLCIPWLLKPIVAPLMEHFSKKKIIIAMQILMACLILLLALCIHFENWFLISALLFFTLALAGSIHDINTDGLYIENLDQHTQTLFLGIRSVTYQIGRLICQGVIIIAVGFLSHYISMQTSWNIMLLILASGIFMIGIYHYYALPSVSVKMKTQSTWQSFVDVMKDFCRLPHIIAAIIFILFFNFAEAQLMKIIPLFLLDNHAVGGLALQTKEVGVIHGVIGLLGLLVGINFSSFLLNRYSLRQCLIPFTLAMVITNSLYLLFAFPAFQQPWLIALIILLTQIFFGIANGAYMLYCLNLFSQGHYRMSLYAFGTSLMILGITVAGAISGHIQSILGYHYFFMWIILLSIGVVFLALYNVKKVFMMNPIKMSLATFENLLIRATSLETTNKILEQFLLSYSITTFSFTYYSHYSRALHKLKYDFTSQNFTSWHHYYHTENYADVDSVLENTKHSVLPTYWNAQQQLKQAKTKREKQLRIDSIKYGAEQGLSIPLHGANENFATLLLVQMKGEDCLTQWQSLQYELFSAAYYYFNYFQGKLIKSLQPIEKYKLNKRELQCLLLIAKQYSIEAIARHLHITERTVNFHVQKLNKKLGTHNKYQSVIKALQARLIVL